MPPSDDTNNKMDMIFVTRRASDGRLLPLATITPDQYDGAKTMRFTLTRDSLKDQFRLDYFQCIEMLAPEYESEG